MHQMDGTWASEHRILPWYALRVRSNFEKKTAAGLRERGLEEFSPLYKCRSHWSDRVKLVERPLFPGYVFCRLDAGRRLPVLQVPGVVQIVQFGNEPAPVEEREIESLRALVHSGTSLLPYPFLHVGDRVLIERGPLAGVEGILERFQKGYRIVVSISLLQRSVSAELDIDCVFPGPDRKRLEARMGRAIASYTGTSASPSPDQRF
jgi:transcription antitermination factor NusG